MNAHRPEAAFVPELVGFIKSGFFLQTCIESGRPRPNRVWSDKSYPCRKIPLARHIRGGPCREGPRQPEDQATKGAPLA